MTSSLTPHKVLRHIRKGTVARAATVYERDPCGRVVTKILDVEDVEKRTPQPKEIVVVDKEFEREIRAALKRYSNTMTFIAVMVVLILLVSSLNFFFG